jgi:5-formyltetrahydrofolate cyclo-ligase
MDGARRGDDDDDETPFLERKAALREEVKARRAALPPAAVEAAGRAVARHVLRELPWPERPRVSVFWPLTGELDTRPVLHCLRWLGAVPLLPRMRGRGRPLAFHPWSPDLPLAPGPLGVMEPPADAPEAVPDIVLAPLLAFDRLGRRLGYGAGYYDRTFEALAEAGHRPLRCGLALALQEVPEVPETAGDVRLEAVVTEAGLRRLPS